MRFLLYEDHALGQQSLRLLRRCALFPVKQLVKSTFKNTKRGCDFNN